MDSSKETRNTWNKLAELYQEKFMHLRIYDESYTYLCKILQKENARVLDAGCGPGNISHYLIKQRPDFKIEGIDNAPTMIELARRNNPSGWFRVFDCRNLKQLDTHYDAIVCGFCLPYLTEPESAAFIADSAGILNADGLLYLSFVEGLPEQSGFKTGSSGDRLFFHYYQEEKLAKTMINSGLEIVKRFYTEYAKADNEKETHTVLIARKSI